MPRRHLIARARHRHGRDRPRLPGRVARLGRPRHAARRPGRPPGRRAVARAHLPEVPRRPGRVRRRRGPHGVGADRGDARPQEPARRALPAARGGLLATDGWQWTTCTRWCCGPTRTASSARPARRRARHAAGPLPVGRVRRAAPAPRLGPRRGHGAGPRGGDPHRDRERRHDPRPRALRRLPGRRLGPRRRARRGDGLRGARGPGVPARRELVADRGDHARPRARLPRARRARAIPFWKGEGSGGRPSWAARSAQFMREIARRLRRGRARRS